MVGTDCDGTILSCSLLDIIQATARTMASKRPQDDSAATSEMASKKPRLDVDGVTIRCEGVWRYTIPKERLPSLIANMIKDVKEDAPVDLPLPEDIRESVHNALEWLETGNPWYMAPDTVMTELYAGFDYLGMEVPEEGKYFPETTELTKKIKERSAAVWKGQVEPWAAYICGTIHENTGAIASSADDVCAVFVPCNRMQLLRKYVKEMIDASWGVNAERQIAYQNPTGEYPNDRSMNVSIRETSEPDHPQYIYTLELSTEGALTILQREGPMLKPIEHPEIPNQTIFAWKRIRGLVDPRHFGRPFIRALRTVLEEKYGLFLGEKGYILTYVDRYSSPPSLVAPVNVPHPANYQVIRDNIGEHFIPPNASRNCPRDQECICWNGNGLLVGVPRGE